MTTKNFCLEDYDYHLPENLIAQAPAPERHNSRLLVVDRPNNSLTDLHFSAITRFFKAGDLLLVNDTKVFPARLFGKKETGGKVELFLLEYPSAGEGNDNSSQELLATALVKSSKRPKIGSKLHFGNNLQAIIEEYMPDNKIVVRLNYTGDLEAVLENQGHVPLPPYIKRGEDQSVADRHRYQTVYANKVGAVAAPTAGLHFSEKILKELKEKRVSIGRLTLHVGYGTFAPVRADDIRNHQIHSEYISISEKTANLVNKTKEKGKSVWCVGTTTARAVEFCADENGLAHACDDFCNLYIYPGYSFKIVKNLITNFHLPKSSLLFLVSALIGRETILEAYHHAIEQQYRFYSYGDAMLIIS